MKVYKKALVTGGAQRIGASIAFYLANMGIDVAIQYNSSEKEMNNVLVKIVILIFFLKKLKKFTEILIF